MHSVNDPAAPRTKYVRGELDQSSFGVDPILTLVGGHFSSSWRVEGA
jgi:hypothetical protein